MVPDPKCLDRDEKTIIAAAVHALYIRLFERQRHPRHLQFSAERETYGALRSTDDEADVLFNGYTDGFTLELQKGEYRIACGTGIAFDEVFPIKSGRTTKVHYLGSGDYEFD
ncbi:MAG: hypothetical protein LIO85_10025 [Rikenellaceae bacterium]|nr:hypothetical protein [Rikenellaceae bacterium]